MGLLDWWRGRDDGAVALVKDAAVLELVEHIVDTTNPKLRFVWHYQQRLAPVVASAMAYLVELLDAVPPARLASAAGWAADPYLRAFFATPDDLRRAFSGSDDLRAWFDQHPLAEEVHAVLGMEMTERNILGMALENGTVRQDVAQRTVSFGDYRVRICGGSEEDLRREIETRIVHDLALLGLARAASDQARRLSMERERALLKTRLTLLERQGRGMCAVVGGNGGCVDPGELARLTDQLEENARNLAQLGLGAHALEGELGRVVEALAEARQELRVSRRRLRLDRMNLVRGESDPDPGLPFEFQIVHIAASPPQDRAFVLVRFPRAELREGGLRLQEAARILG